MICDYPDTGILKVSFWSFLSNTKNGANFNLPTPYGRTTIHEKLSASGKRGGAKQPHDTGSAHGSRWGIRPYPTVIGFMAEWHWQNVGFNLPLLSKLHKIWSVDSQENHENCCHQMSDFKTKMHQIRFRLGLRPGPRWESLQRSPSPLAGFGALLLRGMRGEGMEGEEGREGKGREGKGRGSNLPKVNFLFTSLSCEWVIIALDTSGDRLTSCESAANERPDWLETAQSASSTLS